MKPYFLTRGKNPLQGKIFVQGSKNEILPIMAATVLMEGETVLSNVPKITDVDAMVELLVQLGAKVKYDKNEHRMWIRTDELEPEGLKTSFTEKLRCSVLFLGSLLGRFGMAALGYPGGCEIGKRPIDLHVEGLRKMGVNIEEKERELTAQTSRLQGCYYYMRFPSVGATQNLLLAAVCAEGTTILENCACEPEVVSLCNFLLACGARIEGIGLNRLVIYGRKGQCLTPVSWVVGGDRIAAATYLMGACVTGGEVTVEGIDPWELSTVSQTWMRMGARIVSGNHRLTLHAPKKCRCLDYLATGPYPGFPTDLQSMLLAALSIADGVSVVEEKIFEGRFLFLDELEKCGAHLKKNNQRVMIWGVPQLSAADLYAGDLRSGAALLLCGLMAEGSSRIFGIEHILRGYEDIEVGLKRLGADIILTGQE